KGNSSSTVKIRTRTPRSRSVGASRGRMNVVSERFISLAINCISPSLNSRPSKNTASEFPSSSLEVNTSHCAIARRRFCTFTSSPKGLRSEVLGPRPHTQDRKQRRGKDAENERSDSEKVRTHFCIVILNKRSLRGEGSGR